MSRHNYPRTIEEEISLPASCPGCSAFARYVLNTNAVTRSGLSSLGLHRDTLDGGKIMIFSFCKICRKIGARK